MDVVAVGVTTLEPEVRRAGVEAAWKAAGHRLKETWSVREDHFIVHGCTIIAIVSAHV